MTTIHPDRIEALAAAKSLVVKVGTRVLTHPDGQLDHDRIAVLSNQLCDAFASKNEATLDAVVLVSSGAVGAGVGKLGLTERPRGLADLQAVAAIGQAELIQSYERAFAAHGRHAAQVLLTAEDLRNRASYLNVRNALRQISAMGAIPVINENDSVAVDELMTTFGDNDRLAASVAGLLNDALLVILSDVEGLYDGAPSDPNSQVIRTVKEIDDHVTSLACDATNSVSKGGMSSKLQAAKTATSHGHSVIIAPGRVDDVLQRILRGEAVGTLFKATGKRIRGRQRWIDSSAEVVGKLSIDAGAARAIAQGGNSLLAVGIVDVIGEFQVGEVVAMLDPFGSEIARGLTNYSGAEARKIKGLTSDNISAVLGHRPFETVVHCDNLVLSGASRMDT